MCGAGHAGGLHISGIQKLTMLADRRGLPEQGVQAPLEIPPFFEYKTVRVERGLVGVPQVVDVLSESVDARL